MPLPANELDTPYSQKATYVAPADNVGRYVSQRPPEEKRLFRSDAIEKKIKEVKALLKNPYLAWMFENCFPNTLDTTVHFRLRDGKPDTFVYTGDIHAMWLRDSGAQVWPYIGLEKICCMPTSGVRHDLRLRGGRLRQPHADG